MGIFKVVLKWSFFLVLSLLVTSCQAKEFEKEKIDGYRRLENNNRITIGFSIANFQEERWLVDRDIFVSKSNELGANVIVSSANGDAELQKEQCEKLLSKNIDVLVIIAEDSEKAAEIVEEANKKGVPVVAYDRLIRNASIDAYVTYDNVKIGEMQAEYLVGKVPRGNYVLLGGAYIDYCSIQVREGQMNVLKPYIDRGDIVIVEKQWVPAWNPFEARNIVEKVLMEYNGDIQAVLASNDGTAGGAIQALAEHRLAGKIEVSGQDADLAGCQRIIEQTQSMTVYVPIKDEAEAAAKVAVKLAKKEEFIGTTVTDNGKVHVPTLLLEPTSVDKNNIEDTVIKDGYQNYEDVFRNTKEES